MKQSIYNIAPAIFIATAMWSCSCESHSQVAEVRVEPRDSAAYYLGEQHGRRFLEESNDTDAMADYLLEVRARETNFRSRIRPSAADAYVEGFRKYITIHTPELAQEIF